MSETINERIETPVWGEYDVIVCGGGVAGLAAAVSASRSGANVLLLEKNVILGGLATHGLISWYEPICNGKGKKLMYGMADELLQLALRYSANTLPNEWRNNPDVADTNKRFSSFYSPAIFALALDQWILDAGVNLLLDTIVVSSVMEGNHCCGVIVENKTGRGYFNARVVIDATGDADILFRSGVPCINGRNYLTYIAYATDFKKAKKAIVSKNILLSRTWKSMGANLWGEGHPDDIPVFSEVSAKEITRFVLSGRKLLFDRINHGDKWDRDITILPSMAQLRTTRRLDGDHTLVEQDSGKRFYDSIGVAVDFFNKGVVYELPYRILHNAQYDNLLTAGRSVSSSGWAWEVTRVIPIAIATGQAAGIAAAECVKDNVSVKDICIERLQRLLEDDEVHIHIDSQID